MSVDPRIREALTKAVSEAGQPKVLATRLLAWFDALSTGNASIQDRESVAKHLELLYEAADAGELSDEGDK
jgi:hypothetical protein